MGIVNHIAKRFAAVTAHDAAAVAARTGAAKEAAALTADRVVLGFRPRSAQVVKVRDQVVRFGRTITLADVQAEKNLMASVGVTGYRPHSLRGADLRGRSLAGLDLSHFDLTGARLQGANLDGAILGHREGQPVKLKSLWNFHRQTARREELRRAGLNLKLEGHVTHAQ